jgi:hypothetical protein
MRRTLAHFQLGFLGQEFRRMQSLLDSALRRHDLLEELHAASRLVRTLSVLDPQCDGLFKQMEKVQAQLARLPIIDEAKIQLQLEEIGDLRPLLRTKHPGRSVEADYRANPMKFDARYIKDIENGVEHFTAKRRYKSSALARARSALTPIVAEVLESRRKVAQYHVGAVEDDISHDEEFVPEPIDQASQYRMSSVRPTAPWRSKEAKGGEHHDLGQDIPTRIPVKVRNGRRRRRRRPASGPGDGKAASSRHRSRSRSESEDVSTTERLPHYQEEGASSRSPFPVSPARTICAGENGDTVEPLPSFETVSEAREIHLNELRLRLFAAMAKGPLVETSHAAVSSHEPVVEEVLGEEDATHNLEDVEVEYF